MTGHRHNVSGRLLGGVSAAAIVLALTSGQAMAQDASENQIESVVVTASRIVRDGYQAPTPTTVVGAADIEKQSVPNIANYINMLPQLGSGVGASTRTNSFLPSTLGGGNALNLRNLGTVRTLTMLDGRRVVGANAEQMVDVNMLPTNLVARVDVVTGGASAAWGSDAVAGVVNFVLDKRYTGVKGQVGYGQSWRGDGAGFNGDLAFGARFAGGRGHVLLSGQYQREDGIFANGSRDWYTGYKAVPNQNRTATNGQPGFIAYDNAGLRLATSGGVITSGPLAGVQFGPGGTVLPYRMATAGGGIIGVGGDVEDVGYQNIITPDSKNGALFGRVSYDLTDDVNVYLEAGAGWSKGRNHTSQFIRHGDLRILADNPFIPAGLDLRGETSFLMGRNFGEEPFGPIKIINDRKQFRGVLGVDGKTDWFDGSFKWNAYYQHGESTQFQERTHVSVTQRFLAAVDVVRNPAVGGVPGIAVGTPVCRSTITNPTNGCQPMNVFGAGSPSAQSMAWITGLRTYQTSYIKEDVAQAGFQFEPFSLPAGAVSLAGGAEYRREAYHNTVDPTDAAAAKTENIFNFGNYRAGGGKYDVKEAFAEAIVPLLKDVPLIKSLEFSGAVRVTDYSTSGRVTTWKAGGTWDVTDDLRFRGTRSRDIRAPNLQDLFLAGSGSAIGVLVPGTNNQVFATQTNSGNPTLTPEVADTTAFGVVYRPSWLPGFSVSVDRYKISVDNAIVLLTSQQIINNCYGVGVTAVPAACNAIDLNPSPILPGLVGQLSGSVIRVGGVNIARQDVAGYDIEASYRRNLADFSEDLPGAIELRAVGSYLTKYTQTASGRTDNYRGMVFAGVFPIAGGPTWRWLFTGSYNVGPSTTTATVRYVGKAVVNNEPVNSPQRVLQNNIPAVGYLDLNQSWNLRVGGADAQIFAKVENVFDTDPPRVPSTAGTAYASSGTDGSYYDLIGRFWRFGIRFKY